MESRLRPSVALKGMMAESHAYDYAYPDPATPWLFNDAEVIDLLPHVSYLKDILPIRDWLQASGRDQVYASICLRWRHDQEEPSLCVPASKGILDVPEHIREHLFCLAESKRFLDFFRLNHLASFQPTRYFVKKMLNTTSSICWVAPDGTEAWAHLIYAAQSAPRTISKESRYWILLKVRLAAPE